MTQFQEVKRDLHSQTIRVQTPCQHPHVDRVTTTKVLGSHTTRGPQCFNAYNKGSRGLLPNLPLQLSLLSKYVIQSIKQMLCKTLSHFIILHYITQPCNLE